MSDSYWSLTPWILLLALWLFIGITDCREYVADKEREQQVETQLGTALSCERVADFYVCTEEQ